MNRHVSIQFDGDTLLVRREVAEAMIPAEGVEEVGVSGGRPSSVSGDKRESAPGSVLAPKRFYATVELDLSRPVVQMGQIAQSVLSELERAAGAKIRVRLDIEAEAPGGFPKDVEDIIRDSAATLRFGTVTFES